MKLAAVVVLYQPNSAVLAAIQSYAIQVEQVFAIDNSESLDSLIAKGLQGISNLRLISNHGNFGIGQALNKGVQLARENGFEFLLTMDQDSSFIPEDFALFLQSAQEAFQNNSSLALVAPDHTPLLYGIQTKAERCFFESRDLVATSGNIVRIAYCDLVQGFHESLFIDEVDHDFCLRLKSRGLLVMQSPSVHLIHAMGEPRVVHWLWYHTLVSEHSVTRYYYIARNNLYVYSRFAKKYPTICRARIRFVLRYVILLMLMFEKNRIRKIGMILRGTYDFLRGRYGKLA